MAAKFRCSMGQCADNAGYSFNTGLARHMRVKHRDAPRPDRRRKGNAKGNSKCNTGILFTLTHTALKVSELPGENSPPSNTILPTVEMLQVAKFPEPSYPLINSFQWVEINK